MTKHIKILVVISLLFSFFTFAETTQNFSSFTGKIIGNKVRLRANHDLDSHIIKQLNKDELVLIIGEENDFYAVAPSSDFKAYIFRSYVIDNVTEASRINVRLSPSTEAPILTQLDSGYKVEGQVYPQNNKWLEITPPQTIKFYVAKEYVSYAGDVHYFTKMQTRKDEVTKLLNSAFYLTQEECKKPFNEMQPDEAISQFELVIKMYPDFPDHAKQSKEGLALLQDTFLQKKLSYLETKQDLAETEKKELLEKLNKISSSNEFSINTAKTPTSNFTKKETISYAKRNLDNTKEITDKMKYWDSIEESLFLTWNTFHPDKNVNDFYAEQKATGSTIYGTIEKYEHAIKSKPGDYLIKDSNNHPIAYLYSTNIDLDEYLGRSVEATVSSRQNNNFAFPAYFVNSIEAAR